MSFVQGHALLIGVGTYRDAPGLDVPITATDAEAVSAVLRDPDYCGYPPDQVLVLRDTAATREGILAALDQLAATVGEDDTVFFFFCGHGDYGDDGDYYLTTHDTRVAKGKVATGTGVRQAELIGKLRAIKAKRVLLLINACHSGQVSPVLGADVPQLSGHALPSAAAAALLATGEGRIIMTACREEQVSYIGNGALTLFAQALVDGLRGKGTVSSRGYVSAFDLYTHLYFSVEEQVRTRFGKSQEPELTVLKGVGPFAVALFRGSTALGTFDSSAGVPGGTAAREIAPAQAEARLSHFIKQARDNYNATLTGDGANAQGPGAAAVGASGVLVCGHNTGPINTVKQIDTRGGAYFGGNVTSGGDVVGRDKILYGDQTTVDSVQGSGTAIGRSARAAASSGIQPDELDALSALREQSVAQGAPETQLESASRQVQRIKDELASPQPDQDGRLAKLVSAFGNPLPADARLASAEATNPQAAELSQHGEDDAPTPRIATQGGAAIAGSVQLSNGHVIGRDFIQVITQTVQDGEDPAEAQSVISLYLHALAADLAGLKLGEIDAAAQDPHRDPLQLADVYVTLDTSLSIPDDATLKDWLDRPRDGKRDELRHPGEERHVSALEALGTHRELTLLGKPGSGKSTFGAHVLLALAQAWQGHHDQLDALGETWSSGSLLPIRVVLRRFADRLPDGDRPVGAGDLWTHIGDELQSSGQGLSARTLDYIQRIARCSGALILLDGLDECGAGNTRERVMGAVQELMRTADPKCRFLLTARPYAWPGGADPRRGVYALADLSDPQIEQFIEAWYRALVQRGWRSPGEADRKRIDLLAARNRPDLEPLTRNPLLLTLMATLHTSRGRLPDDRADLYNESVDLLMLRWNRQIGADKALLDELAIPTFKLSDLREALEELAFKLHEGSAETSPRTADSDPTADVGEDRLIRALRPLLQDSRDKAAVVVDYIEKRAGLLIGQGEKDGERQFSFPHRTFQEFLAACHLQSRDDFPAECVRLASAAPDHWQVVLALAARLAKVERGSSAADELVGSSSIAEFKTQRQPGAADWHCALMAGLQLREIGIGAVNMRERARVIKTRVAGWLAASLPVHPEDGGMIVRARDLAGDVLVELGDPRFDPDRFHLPTDNWLGFVHIKADSAFQIGTRRSDTQWVTRTIKSEVPDNELNDFVTPTPDVYIARYPVTVAQFRAFVEATGVEPGDADALRDPDSEPVRWVDWHEALAYVHWLHEQLAVAPELDGCAAASLVRDKAWQVALPSELEWEKAARGGLSDTVFSWGNDPDSNRANWADSGIGRTSVVGCFPPNGFGLYDLLGNTWEWTRSLWGKDSMTSDFGYPYDPSDSRREALDAGEKILRVVRGGSYGLPQFYARCACRLRFLPNSRSSSIGFRVVLRAPPVS